MSYLVVVMEAAGHATNILSDTSAITISGTWMYDRDTDAEWDAALQVLRAHI